MTRIQLTLSMEPMVEKARTGEEKVYRLYPISPRAANLLDQMRILTGIPKQEIVERAIELIAEEFASSRSRLKPIP